MHNSSNKGQFYVLTSVVIVGFFFLLSKYVNPYSFIDSSKSITDDEIFFFNNVRDKAEKAVMVSGLDDSTLNRNLNNFGTLAKDTAGEKGYIFLVRHRIDPVRVNFTMFLISDKYTLNSSFTINRP